MKLEVQLTVNRKIYRLSVDAHRTLLDILREELDLTGTKKSCDMGDCGACSVIMNGSLVNSCLVLAGEVDQSEILTIEGLNNRQELHPIQQAFIDEGAIQCGYCTPGMILAVKALLDANTDPTEEDIRISISGNLCRCTGYNMIVAAALNARDRINESDIKAISS